VDEIIQVLHSSPDSIGEILQGVAQDKGAAPLDYIVQHYTMKLIGTDNETAARFHAALAGSISILLVYILAFQLFKHPRIAALSAASYGLYPMHHHYSQEGRPSALFVMLVLGLFIVYVRNRMRFSWWNVLWMSCLFTASFYVHPFTAIIFAVFISTDIVRRLLRRGSTMRSTLLTPVFACLAGAGAFAPWLVFSFANTSGEYPHPISLRLVSEAIQGIGDGSYPLAAAVLALACFGIAYLRIHGRDVLIDLSCWIVVPLPLILFLLYWRSYFFASRQLLFLTPAILMLAACGMEYLLGLYGRKAWAIPAAYAALCLAVIGLHYPDKRMDFRGAGSYLKQVVRKGDGIVAPNSLGILSYYFPEIYSYAYNPSSSEGANDCERIFVVDAQYAASADRPPSFDLQDPMMLQKQLRYRGIVISLFASKPPANHSATE